MVVGSRENIDKLINELQKMELMLKILLDEILNGNQINAGEEIGKVKEDYIAMVEAICEIAKKGNASI